MLCSTWSFIVHSKKDSRLFYIVCLFFVQGDTTIKYFEITDEAPYVFFLSMYQSKASQRGAACMAKRFLNFKECEVMRFYRLVGTTVEPIIMTVPRKVSILWNNR